MNPHLLRRSSQICLTLALIFGGGQVAMSQNSAPSPVAYQTPVQLSAASIAQYQEVTKTTGLASTYSKIVHVPAKYHEPILTRGASGISVFRNASPAVVVIVVGDVKNNEFDPSGLGAGVVIDSSGDILTNWHVINGYGAAVIFFKPQDTADIADSKAHVASVVAQSKVSDLALLHLLDTPPSKASIPIGNISSVQVAEDIHVIGHPKENLWSYSTGVVSQIRDGFSWTYDDGSTHQAKVLQLQTAISPGNSGGPVLDDQGRLLGLIAMSKDGQNLDYAVAADVIQSFLSSAAASR